MRTHLPTGSSAVRTRVSLTRRLVDQTGTPFTTRWGGTKVRRSGFVRPFAQADSHDAPGLIDELVPGVAAGFDGIVIGSGDAVRQPVFAHELPQVLDRVQLWATGWQRQQHDVVKDDKFIRAVTVGLIERHNGLSTGCDMEGGHFQVYARGFAVTVRHDDADGLSFHRADGAKDTCRGAALILRCGRAGAASGRATSELGLLAIRASSCHDRSIDVPRGTLLRIVVR